MRRILILEDDRSVANVYAAALRKSEQAVEVCNEFRQARTELRDHPPDALLTDVRVGEFNGVQLALLFRSQCPSGPLVVVSGHDDIVIRKEVEKLDGVFLLKPTNLAELTKYLSN
jgi:DNA-binding response OmpR family regulator